MNQLWQVPNSVYLYDGAAQDNFEIRTIADYLGQWFAPEQLQIREEFVRHHLWLENQIDEQSLNSVATDLAAARIRDPAEPIETPRAWAGEAAQERAWLLAQSPEPNLFYDGSLVQKTYLDLLPRKESSAQHLHIAFSNRLLGTWDPRDRRYHARVGIYALPSLISVPGVVEGPAKPRGYYFALMAGLTETEVKEDLAGRFVDYGDPRLTELLKGYAVQALFYHLRLEPFCKDPHCRLFNAHWQQEMITAQLGTEQEFCARHQQLLQSLSRT